ncbi:hypothetical protein B0H14DRAFT_3523510 [Mycena olivaceomarginata]|nr:hypothetical protein B0H14DRAFT_3523510 [Mycena olivaceomarginata]
MAEETMRMEDLLCTSELVPLLVQMVRRGHEATSAGGEHLKTTIKGVVVPDYGKVQEILIGVVAAFVIFITVIGPENHSLHFEKYRAAFDVWINDDAENKKASEEQSSTEKPAVTPAWTVLT